MPKLSRALRPGPLGAALLCACACAGCGGSSSGAHSSAASGDPRTTTHVQRGRVHRTATTVTTVATTDPTNGATTTTSDLPGAGKPTVTIGDKNDDEQYLLGQLYLQALEAQGYTVNISQDIGPTAVTMQALKNGTLDMYPEYLDTFDADIAGIRHGFRTTEDAYLAAVAYGDDHDLDLLAPTPFSDTAAIAVTAFYAQRHHVASLAELGRVASPLTIGGAAAFERSSPGLPGLPTLARVYGVVPRAFKSLGVGDQYDDLADATVDAAFVQTTDGQLATGFYRLLRDPRRVFGFGNVVPVVTSATAAREGPAFVATIERVDGLLTTGVMRQLNALVEVAGQSPSAVAKLFLQTHGLLAPTS